MARKRSQCLIVDDARSLLVRARELLERLDYEVETASNARDALELLASRRFALVIVDVGLVQAADDPRPASGLELAEVVRARDPSAAIIIWSGDEAYREQAAALGATFCLKRKGDGWLLRAVMRACGSRSKPG